MDDKRVKQLRKFIDTFGSLAEAKDAMRKATLVVAADDFYQQRRYGLSILLAGQKYIGKIEQYEAAHSSSLEVRPEIGDTVVATVQVGALKQKVTAVVEHVTDKQAHIRHESRRYVVPFTAILEIK